jgi:hypothetical protein
MNVPSYRDLDRCVMGMDMEWPKNTFNFGRVTISARAGRLHMLWAGRPSLATHNFVRDDMMTDDERYEHSS